MFTNLGYFNYVVKYDIVGNKESNEYHAGDQFIKRFREVMEMYIKGYTRLNDSKINELIMSVYAILLPSRRMYEGKIIRNMKNNVAYLVQKSQLLPIRTEELRFITDSVIDVYEPEIFED